MPAYTSITFSFPRSVQPDLIAQFYQIFMSGGIAFKSGKMRANGKEIEQTLGQTIVWNQTQAESSIPAEEDEFRYLEASSVYLDIRGFEECRLLQYLSFDEVILECIVPEGQVSVKSIELIERAALRIWDALPVRIVETSGEIETELGYALVSKGIQPSVMPFAIVDDHCAPLASTVYFKHEKLARGVILRARIEDKTQVLFESTGTQVNGLEFKRICEAIHPQLAALELPKDNMSIEILVDLVKQRAVQLSETNLNQLVFIARDYVEGFRSPHLKGTWIDDDERLA